MQIVGCGNSALAADLFRDGYTDITSTDLSPCCIQLMSERAKMAGSGLEQIKWQVADMLNLPFSDGSFDVVIEKVSSSSNPECEKSCVRGSCMRMYLLLQLTDVLIVGPANCPSSVCLMVTWCDRGPWMCFLLTTAAHGRYKMKCSSVSLQC